MKLLKLLFRAPPAKTVIEYSDGTTELCEQDDAQALVMKRCFETGQVVIANFRPQTWWERVKSR